MHYCDENLPPEQELGDLGTALASRWILYMTWGKSFASSRFQFPHL